jgi:hypothetical protein
MLILNIFTCIIKYQGINEVPGENQRPAASHWQTLSHNVVSSKPPQWAGFELTLMVIDTECAGSCKSKYHAIDHDHDGTLKI